MDTNYLGPQVPGLGDWGRGVWLPPLIMGAAEEQNKAAAFPGRHTILYCIILCYTIIIDMVF